VSEAIQKKISFDFAQIGGVKLHYATAGNGDRLVILLHGFPEFWYSWRYLLVDLSDQYKVVAPDMRGYNLSDKPKKISDYKIDKLVDDIAGLIHHFGHSEAAIIGHDWGAVVSWALASRHPDLVWKLSCMQVPPAAVWKKNQTLKQTLASWYMFFFLIPFIPEWYLKLYDYRALAVGLKTSTARRGVFSDEDITEYKKAWSEPGALTSGINYYRANLLGRLFSASGRSGDGKIKVPTLFIYGEKDHAVLPQTVEGVGDMVDAPYKEKRIPDSGHWVQLEARDEVTAAIREFLAEKND